MTSDRFSVTSPGRLQAALERLEDRLRPGDCRCRSWSRSDGGPSAMFLPESAADYPDDAWGWRSHCEDCFEASPWHLDVRGFWWGVAWTDRWAEDGVRWSERAADRVLWEVLAETDERPPRLSEVEAARLDRARQVDACFSVPPMPSDWWPEHDVPDGLYAERLERWRMLTAAPDVAGAPKRRRRRKRVSE